jgi:poly-gamma-glutamate synthesis protein (capsule biosynthesis protein)
MKVYLLLTFSIPLVILSSSSSAKKDDVLAAFETAAGEEREAESATEEPAFLTIAAVGDNLFHDAVYQSAFVDGGYNFAPIYEHIKEYIEPADIAFINQETVLAGKDFGISSYPLFNPPQELGFTVAQMGFDVVNHASNHAMDKGSKGVLATIDFWDSVPGVVHIGIHKSQDERDRPTIIEKNKMKIGFLAYTYGTNGLPVPKTMPFLVSLIDTGVMAQEIDRLRPLCDVLVVSMHWGTEYQRHYNASQRLLGTFLAEHNVDIVLGHHPHVLQECEEIIRPDGKTTLVFYSLGNFVAAQKQLATLMGGIAYIKLKKSGAELSFEEYGLIPTIIHYERDFSGFQVRPLFRYTNRLLESHWARYSGLVKNISVFDNMVYNLFPTTLITKNPFVEIAD